MSKKRCALIFIILFIFLLALIAVNMVTGTVSLKPSEIISILFGEKGSSPYYPILYSIRLPRIAAAIVLGGALALSGYLLQTFFDNPIVGPFVLGVSSGAKLTVALLMIYFLSKGKNPGSAGMIAAAFIGALAVMGFVLLISFKARNMSILVVCGIMIGYICSAVTDLLVTFADDSNIVNLHNWSMGSLSGSSWNGVMQMSIITFICLVTAFIMSKPMGAYRLGEAYAANMGVNITLLRVMLILTASMLAACVVAFAGPVSFVGIAVPHLMRLSFKTSEPKVLVPASFIGGSVITLLCDCLARNIFAPTEVSISSVTAVLLVPVVIYMMLSRHRRRAA
ncbi:MAG: iron ABC transporter permease [Lachnospiraceae bacterium]|nr:iron ABC transporter permease [Lachnospiraceae bacterium]